MVRQIELSPDIRVVYASEPEEVFREIASGSCVITSCNVPGAAGYVETLEDFLDLNDDYVTKIYDRFVGRQHVVDTLTVGDITFTLKEMCENDYEEWMILMEDGGELLFDEEDRAASVADIEKYKRASVEERAAHKRMFGKFLRERFDLFDMGSWGIYTNNRLIGFITISYTEQGIYLGYCVHSDYRRRGVGSAAAGRMLRYAREELGVGEIFLGCSEHNAASIAMARVLGFRPYRYEGESYTFVNHKM